MFNKQPLRIIECLNLSLIFARSNGKVPNFPQYNVDIPVSVNKEFNFIFHFFMNRKANKSFGFAALTIEDDNDDANQEIAIEIPKKSEERVDVDPVVNTVPDEEVADFQIIKKKSAKPKPKSNQVKPTIVRTINRYWDKVPEPILRAILVMACYDRSRFISYQYYNAALICTKLNQIIQSLPFWRDCTLSSKFMTHLEISVKQFSFSLLNMQELIKNSPTDKQSRTLKNAFMKSYFKSQIPLDCDSIYEYSYQHRDMRRYTVNHTR